jgi:hypothetical protein
MAKKSKKILRQKKPVYKDVTEEEHLELSIKFSERCIDNSGNSIDLFFKGQAERQKKRLQELRAKKSVDNSQPAS